MGTRVEDLAFFDARVLAFSRVESVRGWRFRANCEVVRSRDGMMQPSGRTSSTLSPVGEAQTNELTLTLFPLLYALLEKCGCLSRSPIAILFSTSGNYLGP